MKYAGDSLNPGEAAFYSPSPSWPSPVTLQGCLFCCRPDESLDSSAPSRQTVEKILRPPLPVTLLDVCDFFFKPSYSDSLEVPVGRHRVTMFRS